MSIANPASSTIAFLHSRLGSPADVFPMLYFSCLDMWNSLYYPMCRLGLGWAGGSIQVLDHHETNGVAQYYLYKEDEGNLRTYSISGIARIVMAGQELRAYFSPPRYPEGKSICFVCLA